jgi:hypothetical protein
MKASASSIRAKSCLHMVKERLRDLASPEACESRLLPLWVGNPIDRVGKKYV